jgi:hypothetical protein
VNVGHRKYLAGDGVLFASEPSAEDEELAASRVAWYRSEAKPPDCTRFDGYRRTSVHRGRGEPLFVRGATL